MTDKRHIWMTNNIGLTSYNKLPVKIYTQNVVVSSFQSTETWYISNSLYYLQSCIHVTQLPQFQQQMRHSLDFLFRDKMTSSIKIRTNAAKKNNILLWYIWGGGGGGGGEFIGTSTVFFFIKALNIQNSFIITLLIILLTIIILL